VNAFGRRWKNPGWKSSDFGAFQSKGFIPVLAVYQLLITDDTGKIQEA
jgi:hypothetical protein